MEDATARGAERSSRGHRRVASAERKGASGVARRAPGGAGSRVILSIVAVTMTATVAWSATGFALTPQSGSRPEQVVPLGPAPVIPAGAVDLGIVSSMQRIDVDVALNPRSTAALDSFVAGVSTPASPSYRHFLQKGQFGHRFGAAPQVIAAVASTLRREGLAVGPVTPNDLVLPVRATAGLLAAAFQVGIHEFRLPGGRRVISSVTSPKVPPSMRPSVQAIVGLDDLAMVGPPAASGPSRGVAGPDAIPVAGSTGAAGPKACKGAAGIHSYTAPQIAQAYDLQPLYAGGDMGGGQSVDIYEQSGFSGPDVAAYQRCYGTSVPISVVPVDGGNSSTSGPFAREADLDIEDVIGLAPQLRRVHVFEAPAVAQYDLDIYTAIAQADDAKVVSISANACEAYIGNGQLQAEASEFNQMAAQGQTVFAASGDLGAQACSNLSPPQYQRAVNDPASQPLVTSVGGTNLTSTGQPPLSPPLESAWKSSGGGLSSYWLTPSWQTGPGVVNKYSSGAPCGGGSRGCREVPDVSANAGYCYAMYIAGKWSCESGTSAAAPTWAAMASLIDASSASCAKKGLGLLNPRLYSLALRAPGDFNDVTVGNDGTFPATAHYDLATGLGTPVGARLAQSLCPRSKITVKVQGSKAYGQEPAVLRGTSSAPKGVHLSGTVSCPAPLVLNGGLFSDGPSLAAGTYTVETALCTGIRDSDESKYVVAYTALHNGFVVSKDHTTVTLVVKNATEPVGNETASMFQVTVQTAHHERLPGTENASVAVGSASCVVHLAPSSGGAFGSCSLSGGSALPPGSYSASVTYIGDADLARSGPVTKRVTITAK